MSASPVNQSSSDICSICLDDLSSEPIRAAHDAIHAFHEACLNVWLASKGTCPLCRKVIVVINPAPVEADGIPDLEDPELSFHYPMSLVFDFALPEDGL